MYIIEIETGEGLKYVVEETSLRDEQSIIKLTDDLKKAMKFFTEKQAQKVYLAVMSNNFKRKSIVNCD